jgi:NAD(P)-dependent dehydrogenase (short-subunit alcohol dehydrogenase family)
MHLQEKVAVITGAGSGIGRGVALRFAAEGAKVVVSDVNRQGLEETCEQLRGEDREVHMVVADVSDVAQVQQLMHEAVEAFGKLDILFNNAGIGPPSDDIVTKLPEAIWDLVLNINLRGTFLCCKYGLPHLIANGGGAVVNVASVVGLRANRNIPSTAYTVSKAGVIALTRQLAADYARYQVRVNAICPGPIRTPILAPHLTDDEAERRFRERVPLGRMGTVDDVANLVLFLSGDESTWMTGSIITIDGGVTA